MEDVRLQGLDLSCRVWVLGLALKVEVSVLRFRVEGFRF